MKTKKKAKKSKVFSKCGADGCKFKPLHLKTVSMPIGFSQTSKNICHEKDAKKGGRRTCPVQLTFKEGVPYVRFCKKRNEPGYTVRVASPAEAQRIATEACKCWSDSGKNFSSCDVSKYELGSLRKKVHSKRKGR